MNEAGNTEEFDKRVRDVLRRVAADPNRVDYRERRKVLESLVIIEWDIWRKLCCKSGVSPGKRGGKSRQAAAWLWSELMSSDHVFSPAATGHDAENDLEYYRRFIENDLAALRKLLVDYGEGMFVRYLAIR